MSGSDIRFMVNLKFIILYSGDLATLHLPFYVDVSCGVIVMCR